MSDSEDPIDPIDEDVGDDLFGDDDDVVAPASPQARVLDDDSLASDPEGDDDQPKYGRDDRMRSQSAEVGERRILPQVIERHNLPKPSDKTLRVMRVPKFFKFHPVAYEPDTFEPSEFDVANALSENPKQVLRFKKDPSTSELRSNSNIYRWSDGSVSISVGGEHYEISKKRLASAPDEPYNDEHDGYNYAASVELAANLLVTTDHITEQYNVRPNKDVGDEALARLMERMAEERNEGVSENMIIRTTRDPEYQKKQAELAEKEREKARRRRENAAAKMDGGLGRSGGRGGLSIGDLEGGRRGAGRKRGVPGSGKPKKHRPEYDSDDDLPQGVGRHEEYDREDGFVVGSDDEEMESGIEDDEEEDVEEEDEAPRRKRQRTVEADEDASGDDVEPAETTARSRRRNIIDEDEDDE